MFATNTRHLLEAGNYDPDPRVSARDTNELNRISIAAGYLWWIHTSLHIKELHPTGSAGGLVSYYGSSEARKAALHVAHEYIYEKWGPDYISDPSKRFSTRMRKMISDYIGDDAVMAYKLKTPFVVSERAVPHRRHERA